MFFASNQLRVDWLECADALSCRLKSRRSTAVLVVKREQMLLKKLLVLVSVDFFADADELETTGSRIATQSDAADTKVLRQFDELLTSNLYQRW